MKSLLRWGATLGLFGSLVLGAVSIGNQQVLALPQDQILQKLRSVPVFTIADGQGSLLVATPADNQQNSNNQPNRTSVVGVFISRQDAQAFLEKLKTENAQAVQSMQVVPVTLAQVYALAQENKDKPERLVIDFLPVQQQVDAAVALQQQNRGQAQQLYRQGDVPLFYAPGLSMRVQRNNQQINAFPLFFEREELQRMVDDYKRQNPNNNATIEIEVGSLEGLLANLQSSNDPQLNQIVLVPPKASVDFVRSLQPTQPGSQQPSPNQPANQPAQRQNAPQQRQNQR